MANFKRVLFFFIIAIAAISCKQQANKPASIPVPQMSVEEGKVITEREISVWEFSKTKQLDKLREILADDYIGYFSTGIMRPGEVINLLKKTAFNDYHLSNIVVKPVADNVAIVYYDVVQDVVGADGAAWVPEVSASSTYVKRNGRWYSVFYQEMPNN